MKVLVRSAYVNFKVVVLAGVCAVAIAWTVYSSMSHRDDASGRGPGSSGASPNRSSQNLAHKASAAVVDDISLPSSSPTTTTRSYSIVLDGKTLAEARSTVHDMVKTAIIARPILPSNVGSTEDLAATLSDYMASLVTDNFQSFMDTLVKSGITVPDAWRDNAALEEPYSTSAAWMRAIKFDPAGVLIRPVRQNGVSVDHREETAIRIKRDAGRPSLQRLEGSQVNEYEIVFPAMIPARDHSMFPGRMGMTLSWDPNLKKWLITEACVYDQPMSPSGSVPMPIL